MPTWWFDTCVGASTYRRVSFRDRTVYLWEYGRVMISPPNSAPCPKDTPRSIGRCMWHHLCITVVVVVVVVVRTVRCTTRSKIAKVGY